MWVQSHTYSNFTPFFNKMNKKIILRLEKCFINAFEKFYIDFFIKKIILRLEKCFINAFEKFVKFLNKSC